MKVLLWLSVFALLFYIFCPLSLSAGQSIDGYWRGKGLRLTNFRRVLPKIHFELLAGAGLAVLDGELKDDMISGDFLQVGVRGKFDLKQRKTGKEDTVSEELLPYKVEEVVFQNEDITLAGTLTLPLTAGPHPAVIMITGSGPQNRDGDVFGLKPFRIVADHFTRTGIAVLRYDDRGVGGSTGNVSQATIEDFAEDTLAALEFLQNHGDINPKQIGLCGHSEGGLVAPLVASRSKDVAFIILMAGTGIPGEKILLAQEKRIGRADGVTDEEIKKTLELQKGIFEAVRTGEGWNELKIDVRQAIRAEIEKLPADEWEAIEDIDEYLDVAVSVALREAQSPWFKYFLDYHPAPTLKKVTCPVLALFGELDLQVPAEMNKEVIVNALKKGGNPDYTAEILPKANHLFQEAKTGSPQEYGTLEKEFVPGFLDLMANWILERVNVAKGVAENSVNSTQ